MEVAKLSFDVVQAADLFGEGALESVRVRVQLLRSAGYHQARCSTNISKLDLANFSQCTDDLSSDLVGDVELGQTHIRRAEEGVPRGHGEGTKAWDRRTV